MHTADFLTPQQVAKRLNVTGETVRDWIRTERLAGYRVVGRIRISHEAYDEFVRAEKIPQPERETEAVA